ncbi:MAG TPA: DUF5107 domain-containing protein, partial [Candidatus Blautia stercoravium]|nr:DUF5107 domain-containing protein [Candidatus Blautia stercoravium]
LQEKEIKTAVLENDFLKAVFLPEYGGRMWELWDKTTGKNLLYTNDVLQFSNLAVRNAWFSGGVEWNVGIIGHNPYTTAPLYAAKTELEDHTPVLRMYEYERIRKVPYQMDFWLEEEGRFLNCRMRIVNESSEVIPMYWWSNIAVPEYENGRIVVPAEKAFTYADGAVFKVDIPVVNGIDITDYRKIEKSVDYFFDIPEEKPKYIANVNAEGYGLLQISTKRLRSRKLFSWGNGQASDHWQEFLTDQAGRYTEIQAGLGKTQYGCIPMAPHTAWEWMEQYGVVQLSEKNRETSLCEREKEVTQAVMEAKMPERMERMLHKTAVMAKSPAEIVMEGSGYGALTERGKLSAHLKFVLSSESLKLWKNFFETGNLHQPKGSEIPDDFLIEKENLKFLLDTLESVNKENWYAYYHAGLGYFAEEKYEEAKKVLLSSWKMEKNPWTCHAMASILLVQDRKEQAAQWMEKGLEMERKEIGYLKESFKLLFLCKAYKSLCREFEALQEEQRSIGKLRFYYISSLHHLGKEKEAYELLEENGGLIIDDIREGEDSIAQLWTELYEELYSEKKPVPYRYDFKAF